MATCKDCVHFGICKKGFPWADGKGGGWCEDFKNKSDYVKRECGEWIVDEWYKGMFSLECSNCKESSLYNPDEDAVASNFCPWCGAYMVNHEAVQKMIGGEDDE